MAAAKRPNFLITLADDQRSDTISALYDTDCRTPALDALCARGTAFRNAHHGGCTVHAVCCPSRAQLFTGRQLFTIPNLLKGWWEEDADRYEAPDPEVANVPMLGEQLRRAGYRCFVTGKWHNMQFSLIRNFNDGGAISFSGGNEAANALKKKPKLPGSSYVDRPDATKRGGHFNKCLHDFDGTGEYPPGNTYVDPRHSTEAFTDAVVDFLDNYDGDEPFFIYCPFTAPHGPTQTYQEWHDQYRAEDMRLPENYASNHPWDNGGLFVKDRIQQGWSVDEDQARKANADHYAITAHMDDGIRRIHEALERNGFLDDTVVVHSADHGKSTQNHGLQGKQSLHDSAVKVPLIVAGPGVAQGQASDELVFMHDLFPTLIEAAGAEMPDQVFYESLWPLLGVASATGRERIVSSYKDTQRMVREQRWKLLEYNVEGERRTQLYDMIADPHELNDLADDPAHAAEIARLRDELRAWQQRVGDPITDFLGEPQAV